MSGALPVLAIAAVTAVLFVLLLIFVLIPVFRGIGWLISCIADGVVWLTRHLYDYIVGTISDTVRFIGAMPAMVALSLLSMLNIIIGRWSAAGHFGESFRHELAVAGVCVYRVLLQRPLRLVLLDGLLEGIEQRVPAAMEYSPGRDEPSRKAGTFPGYTIVGSLPGGGSGAKLYIAEPDDDRKKHWSDPPDHVVIKSFALTDGSSLPQIVRESRALEAARKLGLVLDHQMEEHRFYYVMPYHPGDHLGIVARRMHSVSSVDGLEDRQLDETLGYIENLLDTLRTYHAYGLWHKDVKPENLIVHDGRAHLVDLGLVTPLSSGMTLTTHGTEYFRDPELVRQALRGVKVHQVDGTKFDIYAVGAVLYFMIENTFPAHGGLSSIRRRCPEALRWVVRRAMTEYDKRYDSVEAMLDDLRRVRNADDPFSVKPGALPSMRDAAAESAIDDAVEAAAEGDVDRGGDRDDEGGGARRADEAREPVDAPGVAGGAWRRTAEPGQARSTEPQPGASPAVAQRPNLRVTNWWTGAYEPEDRNGGGLGVRQDELRAATASVRHSARTAREQIKAARQRARATQHRIARRSPRSPRSAAGSIAAALVFLLLLTTAVYVVMLAPVAQAPQTQVLGNGNAVPAHAEPVDIPQHVQRATHPALLVNDHPSKGASSVQSEVGSIVAQLQDEYGVAVVSDDVDAKAAVSRILRRWELDGDGFAGEQLRDLLDEYEYAGVVHITATQDTAAGRATDVAWIGFESLQ